jgi:hypothetical protein
VQERVGLRAEGKGKKRARRLTDKLVDQDVVDAQGEIHSDALLSIEISLENVPDPGVESLVDHCE